MEYTIEPHGERYGFPGWMTLYRNGQPIRHFATERSAREWLRENGS